MSLGEKLLNLTAEYSRSVEAREFDMVGGSGQPDGREPSVIAAEYEATLREMLTK